MLPAWCLLDFAVSLFLHLYMFCVWAVFLLGFSHGVRGCFFFVLSEGFPPGGHWPVTASVFIFGLALPGVLAVLFTCVLTNVMYFC